MAMQCDTAQGYLFDRPLHPDQVGLLLRRQAGQVLPQDAPALQVA